MSAHDPRMPAPNTRPDLCACIHDQRYPIPRPGCPHCAGTGKPTKAQAAAYMLAGRPYTSSLIYDVLNTAQGATLDRWGALLDTPGRYSENDDDYRRRLHKAARARHAASA